MLKINTFVKFWNIKFEEKYTDSIVKEIVSFLNGNGGSIYIGVKDNGEIVGVEKIDETLHKISDIITTKIEPNLQDKINSELKFYENKVIIVINIKSGIKKFIDSEYMIKKKTNLANLSFRELKIYYTERGYHLDNNSFETNLNLRNDFGEYNLLAALLSDVNNIPFIFVKFDGDSKASISERSDYGCLLTTYVKIKNRLEAENICVSDTTVRPREYLYLFDYDSVNEAVLNALVHNDWTITEPQISMFSDRIEILSHGGLPNGMTESQFFAGISKPRNSTLMRIFLNMGLVEHTGHGIPTIINKYSKKAFEIGDNYIRCTIPFEKSVLDEMKNVAKNVALNKTEKKVLQFLIEKSDYSTKDLAEKIGVTKRTIERALKTLKEKEIIEKSGKSKNSKWIVVK